ncbi:MAG: TetR-like C-terminal domain-containing protein, partial [Burkholderiales bacterium]
TFYAHYRDKDDLFLSDAEEFLEMFSTTLSRNKEDSARVAPVRECFAHVAEGRWLYESLTQSGRIHDFFELAHGNFARGIERRLRELPRATGLKPERRTALAQGYAGAMLSLLKWWLERGAKVPPQEMDDTFHLMVWGDITR